MRIRIVLFLLWLSIFLRIPVVVCASQQELTGTEHALYQNVYTEELDEFVVWWVDDFEGNQAEWSTEDLGDIGECWHEDDFNAYQEGISWWCGNSEIEGYANRWLQYLETPGLDFSVASGDLELSFRVYLDCEAPGGEPAGYDGWDGANVWVSFDDGATWLVLNDPEPAYGSGSLFGFGYTHGLGVNISGWNGEEFEGWSTAVFSLAGFVGESSVKFRFAFASDGATATPDAGYAGFFLDDIRIEDDAVVYLENDAEDVAAPSDLIVVEQEGHGDVWELQEEEHYSLSHAWHLPEFSGLQDALISPAIELPDTLTHASMLLAYWVWCNMPDSDGNADHSLEDYYAIDISADGGDDWQRLAHDYGVPDINGNSLSDWTFRETGMVGSQRMQILDLTPWAGENIQLRYVGMTDFDHDGGEGNGLFLDNISIIANARAEHDVAALNPLIGFPATVGYPLEATAAFRNMGYSTESMDATWEYVNNQATFLTQETDIEPGETTVYSIDGNPNDTSATWIPDEEGTLSIITGVLIEYDENITNNRSDTIEVDIQPVGHYEYGYDNRCPEWTTTRFDSGEGPITHFQIPEEMYPFSLTTLRAMWNPFASQNTSVRVNFLTADRSELICQRTDAVSMEDVFPDWWEIDLSEVEELQALSTDFWVWLELIDPWGLPHIVYSERLPGQENHFNYDGVSLSESNADWMIRATINADLGIEEIAGETPLLFQLGNAWPNPFNSTVIIPYSLPVTAEVDVAVYNMLGQHIATLENNTVAAGLHRVIWDGRGQGNRPLASGIYFITVNSLGYQETMRVLLLK